MIQENKSLRHFNTFGVASTAQNYVEVSSEAELSPLQSLLQSQPTLILGGGSNMILPETVPGLVLHNRIGGIQVMQTRHNEVVIAVGGGTNWHQLVLWTLQQGFGGIENMALIPGTVGAAPVQNIGAYGVELKDVFEGLTAYDLHEGQLVEFSPADCAFAYRHSIFKTAGAKGRYLITRVRLRLTTHEHDLRTSYGAIQAVLEEKGISSPTPMDIGAAVIEIRRSKLPDWRQLGNAGSFFKNPIISTADFEALQKRLEGIKIPAYPAGEGFVKLAAGWLIDQSGWKGKKIGPVGCYEKQALVIVNHGGATGEDILSFSKKVMADVEEKFGIALEREVNAISG